MFTKKDRVVVGVEISFNLKAIGTWLKEGGLLSDVNKVDQSLWSESAIQSYKIDILPLNGKRDVYYHHEPSVISEKMAGMDFLDNKSSEIKMKFEREGITELHWDIFKGSLLLYAAGHDLDLKLFFSTPILHEVVELQENGVLNNLTGLTPSENKVTVSVSQGEGLNCLLVITKKHRHSKIVSYYNALGKVVFFVQDFPVNY